MPKPSAPAKAQAKKTPKPAVTAQPVAKVMAEKKSLKRAPARQKPAISPEQRRWCVEVASYFIAERRGFTPGCELEDWVVAEAEIDRMLAEGLLNP